MGGGTASALSAATARHRTHQSNNVQKMQLRLAPVARSVCMRLRSRHSRCYATSKSSLDVLDELIFETDSVAKAATVTKTASPLGSRPKEAVAHKSKIRTSVKKLTPLTRLIARMPVDLALTQMALARQKVAQIVKSTLMSCKKNAINTRGMDASRLYVSRVVVGRATPAKRVTFHAKGRIGMVNKQSAHLSIFLAEKEDTAVFAKFPVRKQGNASSRLAASVDLSSTASST